jgi:hypothetical protein
MFFCIKGENNIKMDHTNKVGVCGLGSSSLESSRVTSSSYEQSNELPVSTEGGVFLV